MTFIATAILHLPLWWTVLGLGIPAFAVAWVQIRRGTVAASIERDGL